MRCHPLDLSLRYNAWGTIRVFDADPSLRPTVNSPRRRSSLFGGRPIDILNEELCDTRPGPEALLLLRVDAAPEPVDSGATPAFREPVETLAETFLGLTEARGSCLIWRPGRDRRTGKLFLFGDEDPLRYVARQVFGALDGVDVVNPHPRPGTPLGDCKHPKTCISAEHLRVVLPESAEQLTFEQFFTRKQ